jgi:peptide/nickel transport system permease protein
MAENYTAVLNNYRWGGLLNRRQRTIIAISLALVILITTILAGAFMTEAVLGPNFSAKNLPFSLRHPFGTDWLGRDMWCRTVKGLSVSIFTGLLAAIFSTLIAVVLGIAAATMGKRIDSTIGWLVDVCLGIPHLVLLILISIMLGKGVKGVVIGVAVTHWPSLCRVMRAEVMQLRETHYFQCSVKLGKSKLWIAIHHMLPHLFPQFLVGLILMFPHAILHEASITFLGFGLSPNQPAIGIILAESMSYLSAGFWWLAFFPGIALLIIVRLFDIIGENLRLLFNPASANQ